MAEARAVQTAREPQPTRSPIGGRRLRLQRWQSIALSCLVFLGVVWTGVLIGLWPFTRKAVITALQKESGRRLQIGSFQATFFPLGYVAENLRFETPSSEQGKPSFTVRKLAVVARYSDLYLMRKRVKRVFIAGLHLIVPEDQRSPTTELKKASGGDDRRPRFSEIAQIELDDAVVDFLSADKDSDPFRMSFRRVTIDGVSQNHPASFRMEMDTSQPKGVVHSTGKLGPWDWNDTGNSPFSGSFTFERGDLSVFEGIGGYLKAGGKFAGPLRRVVCNGSVDVPDFHVSGSTHEVPLATSFRATVNGLNADTTFEYVQSHLGGTTLISHGTIKQDPRRSGKDSVVQLTVYDGRIEDLLLLFTRNPQPSMTGTVSLRADADFPPGSSAFLRRLEIGGDFGIVDSHFTRPQTQAPINHLSKSAEGLKEKDEKNDTRIVLSNLKGHVSAKGGVATLSAVSVEVPGAQATLSGNYNLLNSTLNLKGVLRTTGQLSRTTDGVKSAMLKMVTPFLKKHSVTIVPFTITGPARNPSFALDLNAKRRE